MKLIIKVVPPPLLQPYSNKVSASYLDMDEDVRDELKLALLNEQGWICGYCQQKITKENMQIEHFCERSICNGKDGTTDKQLTYANLMAVCSGKPGNSTLNCDSKKATFTKDGGLPMNVSPWIIAHTSGIQYHSTGLINSTNVSHKEEIISILNLNIDYLKDARKKRRIDIYSNSKIKTGDVNIDKMRRLLLKKCEKAGNKYSEPFPGLYEYMQNKFC